MRKAHNPSCARMSALATNYPKIVKALEARCRALFKGQIKGYTPETVHSNVRKMLVIAMETVVKLLKTDNIQDDEKRQVLLGAALVNIHQFLDPAISAKDLHRKGVKLVQAVMSASGDNLKTITALLVAMRKGL